MVEEPMGADRLEVLDRGECLHLLRSVRVGRLVFTEDALPAVKVLNPLCGSRIVPVMELRPAGLVELDAVLALAVAFYAEDGFTTTKARLRTHLRALLRSSAAHVAVASESDKLVGFAITTTSFGLENGLIAELEDLYVVPAARRHGIARRLIDDSARWARESGCAQLELVLAPNGRDVSSLLSYYDRCGFSDDGRRLLARRLQAR